MSVGINMIETRHASASSRSRKQYRFRCACGWSSVWERSIALASDDADQHRLGSGHYVQCELETARVAAQSVPSSPVPTTSEKRRAAHARRRAAREQVPA